jgi:hypothetical protein
MGLPPAEVPEMNKLVRFTLPRHPLAMQYVQWYEAQSAEARPYEVLIEDLQIWQERFGTEKTEDVLLSLLANGKPNVLWTILYEAPRADSR